MPTSGEYGLSFPWRDRKGAQVEEPRPGVIHSDSGRVSHTIQGRRHSRQSGNFTTDAPEQKQKISNRPIVASIGDFRIFLWLSVRDGLNDENRIIEVLSIS